LSTALRNMLGVLVCARVLAHASQEAGDQAGTTHLLAGKTLAEAEVALVLVLKGPKAHVGGCWAVGGWLRPFVLGAC
jgi:hypothetical protein